MENHSALVEEYSCEGLLRFTPLVMLIRVGIAIPLLVVMTPYPIVQSIGFMVCNVAASAWFIKYRPGKSKLKNVFVCIREALILAVNGLFVKLTFAEDSADLYGQIIVYTMMSIYAFEMAAGLIESAKSIIEWLREKYTGTSQDKVIAIEPEGKPSPESLELSGVRPSYTMRTQDSKAVTPHHHQSSASVIPALQRVSPDAGNSSEFSLDIPSPCSVKSTRRLIMVTPDSKR